MTSLVLPSNREEQWRWSDLSALPGLADAQPTAQVPDSLPFLLTDGPKLLFVDGAFDAGRSDPGPIKVGAVDADGGIHPLARLTGKQGWRLHLRAGQAAPGLVQIVHVTTGGADHLAAEIVMNEDAQASVLETLVGDGWANRLTAVTLARSARLQIARRLLTRTGFISLTDRAEVGQGASLDLINLAAGGADTRLDGDLRLAGSGAYAEVGGALLARGIQRHDANLVLHHAQPNGSSRQVWRSVADDRATCSVAARVEVARDAQKTDGEQSLRGLLLARTATVNAKPELEIYADDVKCAHGATVGELDKNALFYLQSRGVAPDEARALLTQAFVADALDRIGDEAVLEACRGDVQNWFNHPTSVPSENEGRATSAMQAPLVYTRDEGREEGL